MTLPWKGEKYDAKAGEGHGGLSEQEQLLGRGKLDSGARHCPLEPYGRLVLRLDGADQPGGRRQADQAQDSQRQGRIPNAEA